MKTSIRFRGICGGLLTTALLVAAVAWASSGQEQREQWVGADSGEILLPRHPAPSPDGSRIAFSYQGDIWVVGREGGEARRLTVHPGYDGGPVWSPSGDLIAFYSNRDGNADVYVIPMAGGKVRRLTWHSDYDYPTGWTPDGKAILFQSERHVIESGNWGIFIVSLDGGMPVALLPIGGSSAVLSPDGRRLAFQRGSVSWWRRGYEGNARFRLWLFEMEEALRPAPGRERFGDAGSWGGDPDPSGTVLRSDKTGAGSEDAADAPIWEGPACVSAGLLAAASLRPEGRYFNLTERGAVTRLPSGDDPRRGFLATYLSGPPDWSRPEIEVGINRSPQWFPDGDHLLYLSEFCGVANLKLLSISGESRAWLTRLTEGRLRFPALSRDGSLAAFEYEDGIYTLEIPHNLPAPGSSEWPAPLPEPRRLRIRVSIDERAVGPERLKVKSGASEMALSPDGKQIAFVCKDEIFAMKTAKEESSAYRLTHTAARDDLINWSADSKFLAFVSDRDGSRDVYLVRSTDEDEPRLARTLHREMVRLTDDPRDEWAPVFSPDGEKIAYQRGNGTLMVMNADGSDKRVLVEGWAALEYHWSPDSKWLVYDQSDDDANIDIWIISADGKEGPHNVSRHPDDDYSPCWSADGKMIAFVSERTFLNQGVGAQSQADIWYVWLSLEDEQRSKEDRLERLSEDGDGWPGNSPGDARRGDDASEMEDNGGEDQDQNQYQYQDQDQNQDQDEDKEKGKDDDEDEDDDEEQIEVQIDFENIHKRLRRLTTFPGGESRVLIAKDASGFAFVSNTDGKRDLWWIKWDGSEPKRLTKGGQDPKSIQLNKKGDRIFYLNEGGTIASVPFKGGETETYPYESEMTIDRAAQRGFVFDEAWRLLNDRFYDAHLHGIDWRAMHEKYRPWAIAASTCKDFRDVIRLMMGELNSSHLGIWGGAADPGGESLKAQTGVLGVLYDPTYEGPGLRIVRVIKETPADRRESLLEEGEIIVSINGISVDLGVNLALQLDRTVGKRILLEVKNRKGKQREVVMRPISPGRMRRFLSGEEIEARRSFVAEHSGGRIAYVHIDRMDGTSLNLFSRDLYAEAHGKDALLIDVRGNSGGWITDLLLTSLMAADHAIRTARGAGPGYPEDRRFLYAWTKPAVVLCDEHSFSNAEIFSWAMRTLRRAPVVGQQTAGGVISTGRTQLGDGATLRLPSSGWVSHLDGSNLEGTGCMPDIVVENRPEELARGIDLQLERALLEALKQID